MNDMLLALGCAVTVSAVLNIAVYFLSFSKLTDRINLKELILPFILNSALSATLIICFNIIASLLKISISGLDIPFAVLFTISLGAVVLIKTKTVKLKYNKLKKCIAICAVGFIVIVLCELSIFNLPTFSTADNKDKGADIDLSAVDKSALYIYDSGAIDILSNNGVGIEFDSLSTDVNYIAVELSGEPKSVLAKVAIKDSNLSVSYTDVAAKYIASKQGYTYFNVSAKGLTALKITLENAQGCSLNSVVLNPHIPLCVNYLRLFSFCFVFALAVIIWCFKLYRCTVNTQSTKQWIVKLISVVACVAICVVTLFAQVDTAFEKYNKDENVDSKAVYVQLFDAFKKGQTDLDIAVDQKLIAAGDDAYDPQYRSSNHIGVAWDRAYYDGNYYCYFGPAPVILLYYPVYLVSGYLPSNPTACVFFAILVALFSFLLVFEIAKRVSKKPNFILTLLLAIAFPFAAGGMLVMTLGDMYSIPILCAMAFMLLLFYLSFKACHTLKWYLFLGCALCASVVAASRPTALLSAIALAPLYIGVLKDKNITLKRKLRCVTAFAVPLIITASLLMAYNYARFGSLFEFGAKYQLTVSDISFNTLSCSLIPAAIFHYLFQPFGFCNTFPYITGSYYHFGNYSRYIYAEASFGALSLPMTMSVWLTPAFMNKERLQKKYRNIILIGLICAAVVAWLDFSMAGVNVRYITDILPILCVSSAIILLSLEQWARANSRMYKYIYIAVVSALVMTVIIGLALMLSVSPHTLRRSLPELYDYLQQAFGLI